MKTYLWRKNITATFSNHELMVRGKLAFKTKETHWLDTETPVVVLVSVHSAFHEEVGGDLKMKALISTIRNHTKGKVTVLLSDRAHMNTHSLHYEENREKAFKDCLDSAHKLKHRYQSYFNDCKVEYWHSYIFQDSDFDPFLNFLIKLYQTDSAFRELLYRDAEATYVGQRVQFFSDKALFIEKAIEDLLEQCACLLVLANKGYRFQFYPGRPYASIEYTNLVFIPVDKQISWIDVFLSIEKKTVISLN